MLRVVLYAEDTVQARRFVDKVEKDPRWELIALCTTPADLNFVLDRVTVDVLLLQLTPETEEGVISAVRERTRRAHILVWVHSCVQRQFRAPNDLLLADREPQCLRRRWEGEFWAPCHRCPNRARPAERPRTLWERRHIAGLTAGTVRR